MEIYVQSRGVPQDLGYCWLERVPPLLSSSRVMDLIQLESLSIVLARYSGQLLLLVTGLESARQDFRGRPIKNSVVWISADTNREAERQFRAIAIRALRGELTSQVDTAIESHRDLGFDFDKERLQGIALEDKVSNAPADTRNKVAHNCPELREELALELQDKVLPSTEGPLVVVTGIRPEEILFNAGVWRASSSSIKTPSWEERRNITSKSFFLIAITILLIVVAITITLLVWSQNRQDNKSSIQEIQSINSLTSVKPSLNSSSFSKEPPSSETLETLSPSINEF